MLKKYIASWRRHWQMREESHRGGLDILRHIGPGLLVTVGFIDPGNWASNFAAGSQFGYALLWVVTLSTVMLIVLQHNVAHLGIVSGLCLSEATTRFSLRWASRTVLGSAMLASVSTSLAEILGAAIALQMLFGVPLLVGAAVSVVCCTLLLFTNSYKRVERGIIAFVSLIGFSFLYELTLSDTSWSRALADAFVPTMPEGSLLVVMSVLGAVVMPHNLFLHSEVVQSRQIHKRGRNEIRRQLKYEFVDTLLAMTIGWAINSAMIILAADTFFTHGHLVESLPEAGALLVPLLGKGAMVVFALALLLAGISSTVTSGMAAGSIFAGMYDEPYEVEDVHSRAGILISFVGAFLLLLFVGDSFRALIVSQAVLSLQLPFTVFTQVRLTSSSQVMGEFVNSRYTTLLLYFMAVLVTVLNVFLLGELVTSLF